jgi:tetratricopeptide (TPR) repeat protein
MCPPYSGHNERAGWCDAFLGVAVALAIGVSVSGALAADPPPDPAKPIPDTAESREADALFVQLLKDPKNVDLTFRYAEAAVKAGNIEAAISSLERLLLLNRNFPGVKVELAELYARLHSYDMAQSYLDQAEQEPDTDEKARARIQAVRDNIKGASSPSNFTTNMVVGVRHQSDASAEPAGADIIAGGVPQTLSTIYINKPAWDTFVTGNVQHVYDLGDVKLESNVLAYYSNSIGHSDLDLGALEINTGPRFDVSPGDIHIVSARPYILGNEVLLGESQFLHSVGAGLTLDRSITETLSGAGFYEFRSEWFSKVTLSPQANTMNANVHSFGAGLTYHVVEDGELGFQVSYALTNTLASVGSNKGLVFHLTYAQLFQLPSGWGVGPLSVSPLLYRIYSRDDSADPTISPTTVPATNEWRYGITGKLGLTDSVAVNLHFVRQVATSNTAANREHNTQVILGLVVAY